jgi:cell division protein FtsB
MLREVSTVTAKKINEAHRLARSSAETAVQHAIRCGQMLAQRKAELDRGEFDAWVEKHCEFGRRTAYVYIKASKSCSALHDSSNAAAVAAAFSSLRGLLGQETPEQKDGTPNQESQPPVTSARSVKGAVMNPPESAAQGSEAGNRQTPVGVDAGPVRPPVPAPEKLVEVAPAPDFDFSGYEPEDDDAYKANIENVMMADDKLTAMREELKQLHREVQGLKASRDHYQSEAGSAVRLVKLRDREIEKLRKDLEKVREQNEALRERIASTEAA